MTADTAATAALGPEPIPGSGPGRPPTTPLSPAPTSAPGNASSPRAHLLPPGTAPRPHRHDRHGHRRTRPVYDTAAERGAARRVRQPPRDRLPGLLGRLQARRPPARPRGPGRRQGHPRDDHRAPVRVRHPHRAVVRPGPLPADARQDRAALPPPPRRQGPPLPARPRHLLPDPPRRGRPPARPADVPATATTTPPPCCSTPTRATCGAGSSPTCPATWPAAWASPRRTSAPWPGSGSSRSPNTRHAASSTSTPSSAWTPPARTTSPRPPASPPRLLCDAIGLAAAAAAARHRAPGPGRQARLRRADRHPDIRHGHDLPGTGQALNGVGRRQLHRQVRHQDPAPPPACPPPDPAAHADIDRLRCSAHYRRHDHHRLAARQRGHRRPAVPGLGAHARLRRPLPHQIPPLLGHLRPAPRRPHRATAAPHAPRTPTATPGAGPWTRPSSWSCPPSGPTKAPAAPSRRR